MADRVVNGVGISVVVCTYRRERQLVAMLEALAGQTVPKERFEVVLVDDSGAGVVKPVVARFAGRLQIRVAETAHLGPGPARWEGVTVAAGEWLAMTDDDCVPARDWLERVELARKEDEGSGIGGVMVNGFGDNRYAEATQWIVDRLMAESNLGEVRFLPTANVAFPAERFRRAKALEPGWGNSGGEDREMCRRWREAGNRMRYDAGMVVHHYHWLDAGSFLDQHYRYGKGAAYYHRRPEYANWRFYWRLVWEAVRSKGIWVGVLVVAAQVACGWGWLKIAARRRQ